MTSVVVVNFRPSQNPALHQIVTAHHRMLQVLREAKKVEESLLIATPIAQVVHVEGVDIYRHEKTHTLIIPRCHC